MDVSRAAGAVPAPFAVIVFAPGLPVEIEDEAVNGDLLGAIGVDDLRHFRLRGTVLAVHEAQRPLRHHRRVAADIGDGMHDRFRFADDGEIFDVIARAAAELQHPGGNIEISAIGIHQQAIRRSVGKRRSGIALTTGAHHAARAPHPIRISWRASIFFPGMAVPSMPKNGSVGLQVKRKPPG